MMYIIPKSVYFTKKNIEKNPVISRLAMQCCYQNVSQLDKQKERKWYTIGHENTPYDMA